MRLFRTATVALALAGCALISPSGMAAGQPTPTPGAASASLNAASLNAQGTSSPGEPGTYRVQGDLAGHRQEISASGAVIEGHLGHRSLLVTAQPSEAQALRQLGLTVTPTTSPTDLANERVARVRAERARAGQQVAQANDFPAGDEAYHTVEEVKASLDETVRTYPDLASTESIGRSTEGRDLWMIKLGKGAPEVVLTCNQHAREHLTTEQCLDLVSQLTKGYQSDPRIKKIMDTRTIWVMPVMNPDGSAYDISGGKYQGWRKNRAKNADGSLGVDLNRNWGYKWGCCGGASNTPSDEDYRGPSAFSSAETKAVADFIKERNGSTHNVKAFMDLHTFGELVLWPFGYTEDETPTGMTKDQAEMHRALGTKIASLNTYEPFPGSQLYVTDGSSMDWTWGDQQIPTLGMELSPRDTPEDGFYPPAADVPGYLARNREALLTFLELAECPYTLTGKEAQYCSGTPTPEPTTPQPTTPQPTTTPTSEPTTPQPTTTPTSEPTTPQPTTTPTADPGDDWDWWDWWQWFLDLFPWKS